MANRLSQIVRYFHKPGNDFAGVRGLRLAPVMVGSHEIHSGGMRSNGFALWSVPASRADAITFNFTGTVTQVNFDPSDPFSGSIVFGTPITGAYTFDSASMDSAPADPSTGSYQAFGTLFGATAAMGGNTFSTTGFLGINVFNSNPDQYGVLACAGGPGSCFSGDLTISLFLQDASGGVFSSDALPLNPPALSSFQARDFALFQNFSSGADFFQIEIEGH